MKPVRALLSVAALAMGSTVAVARAADAPATTVHLEVRAAPDCTSQEDLTGRVVARLPRIHFGDDATALVARARFTTLQSGNVLGELTLVKPGAKPSLRSVVARSCAQAADAVALIIAVTVDPTALSDARLAAETTPAKDAANSKPPPREGASNKGGESRGGTAEAEAERQQPAELEADAKSESSNDSVSSSSTPAWPRFGAHVAGQALFGVAPGVMPGVSLDFMAGLDRDALWSPAIVLTALHAWSGDVEETGGTAAFVLDAASLDACALRLQGSWLEGRACASALVGRLAARGSETSNAPDSVSRPFAAMGASVLVAGRLDPMVELWLRSAVDVNLVRDSFEFAPYVFHTVAPMSFSVSVGIGLRSR